MPGGAEGPVIVLRFWRTGLGGGGIFRDTMTTALRIGLHGESERAERLIRGWARRFLRVAGAQVIVRRDAELDRNRSYVFVSNHTSYLDVPAIISVADHPLRFIAKQELTYIPLFGWAARRVGHVFIDRKDRRGATKAIRDRFARGLRGASLFFFAEGTRAVGDALLTFQKGPALAALAAGLGVVAIAAAGRRP